MIDINRRINLDIFTEVKRCINGLNSLHKSKLIGLSTFPKPTRYLFLGLHGTQVLIVSQLTLIRFEIGLNRRPSM